MREHAGYGLLDQIEDVLETVRTAVVGIRHIGTAQMWCELEQETYAIAILRRAYLEQRYAVQLVHRDDELEVLEVALVHPSRTLRAQIHTAPLRRALRARIGRISDVIRVRTGRIDLHVEVGRALKHDLAKNPFRSGRAADVTHANEQHAARREPFGLRIA